MLVSPSDGGEIWDCSSSSETKSLESLKSPSDGGWIVCSRSGDEHAEPIDEIGDENSKVGMSSDCSSASY